MGTENVEKLKKELNKINKELAKGKGKNKEEKELDPNQLRGLVETLTKSLEIIQNILDSGEDICPKVSTMEQKIKRMEDEADHHH